MGLIDFACCVDHITDSGREGGTNKNAGGVAAGCNDWDCGGGTCDGGLNGGICNAAARCGCVSQGVTVGVTAGVTVGVTAGLDDGVLRSCCPDFSFISSRLKVKPDGTPGAGVNGRPPGGFMNCRRGVPIATEGEEEGHAGANICSGLTFGSCPENPAWTLGWPTCALAQFMFCCEGGLEKFVVVDGEGAEMDDPVNGIDDGTDGAVLRGPATGALLLAMGTTPELAWILDAYMMSRLDRFTRLGSTRRSDFLSGGFDSGSV